MKKREQRKKRPDKKMFGSDLSIKKTRKLKYIVERERHGLMWGKKIKERYFAAEGDVWGIKKNMNFRGFKVGDSVQWKLLMITKTGLITNLKNAVECTIREDETNKIYTVKYEALLKIE
jgi:hypothetical protein